MSRTKADSYTNGVMREYIIECFRRLGRQMSHCELCGKPIRKVLFHHTKYEGATIHDLEVVCSACNQLPENLKLA